MELDIFAISAGVCGILVALFAIWRSGGTISIQGVTEALTDIETAIGAAREYVLAAEQLWTSGRLNKDSRLQWVYDRLKTVFPDMADETLLDSIEAAVAWAKLAKGKLAE